VRTRFVVVVVSAALLTAGSAAARGEDTGSPEGLASVMAGAASAAPDTLVLRTRELRSGPAPWERGVLPAFSLYGGGRVIVPGSSAGALQRAREFRLPAPRFARLVEDAGMAGLDRARVYEDTDTMDASALWVSMRTADGVRVTRIIAPEEHGSGSPGRVVEYVEQLPSAPRTAHEFQPTALAVLATGGVSEGQTAAVPWPLHTLAEGTRTSEGRCTVVTGDELVEAARLAVGAEQRTRWNSDGELYAVSFRPLLPDEHTCGDIDIR
jgi:hypothetical protein